MRVPDLIEPFIAWRVWDVCVDGNDYVLESLFYPTNWTPGEPMKATCRWGCPEVPADVHIDPQTYGTTVPCGIYAGKTLEQAAGYLPAALRDRPDSFALVKRTRAVIGQVAMWGVVKEHRMGYRAQFAKPVALWVPVNFGFPLASNATAPERVARVLRDTYDVPVHLFRHVRDLEEIAC